MTVSTGDLVAQLFTTASLSTGAALDADSLPSGALFVNGVSNAATVTIANVAGTGRYTFSVTMPTIVIGDRVQVLIDATIEGLACTGEVWADSADSAGTGTYSYTDTVDDGSGNLLDGVFVELSTDAGKTNIVYTTHTNSSGAFTVYDDTAGTHYRWLQLAGYEFTQGVAVTLA